MDDALAGLPRLKAEQLAACTCCDRPLLQDGILPLFYRIQIKRCGIDGNAIRERVGLMQIWGGDTRTAGLAEIFASRDPGVVMDQVGEVNVCLRCAAKHPLDQIFAAALAREDRHAG